MLMDGCKEAHGEIGNACGIEKSNIVKPILEKIMKYAEPYMQRHRQLSIQS